MAPGPLTPSLGASTDEISGASMNAHLNYIMASSQAVSSNALLNNSASRRRRAVTVEIAPGARDEEAPGDTRGLLI